MNNFMKFLFVLLISLFFAASVTADKGRPYWYMDFDFHAADSLVCGQQQTFALTLSRNKTTTAPSFSIRFKTYGGITLREKTTWHETLDDRPMYTRIMNMIVPCGDTSGILFWVDFGTGEQLEARSFVPTVGGVKMIPFDARSAAKFEREKGDTLGYLDSADRRVLKRSESDFSATAPSSRLRQTVADERLQLSRGDSTHTGLIVDDLLKNHVNEKRTYDWLLDSTVIGESSHAYEVLDWARESWDSLMLCLRDSTRDSDVRNDCERNALEAGFFIAKYGADTSEVRRARRFIERIANDLKSEHTREAKRYLRSLDWKR